MSLPAPAHTGSKGTRALGVMALVGLAALGLFALVLSPADDIQGDAVRIMYIHVPAAIGMFTGFVVTAVASFMYLRKRTRGWDTLAVASAEVGVVYTGLCLLTGMLWGRPIWGVYWTWDARLTSTALLFLLYLGYLTVRRLPGDTDARSRRAAWVALLAFIDVPIVHYSVNWWRGLHQEATLTRLDPTIDNLMLFTLMLGILTFTVLYAWLVAHRFRLAWLEDEVERSGLQAAIDERRAEATEARVAW